jgi:hypothetical protein
MNGWEALASIVGALVMLEMFAGGVSAVVEAWRHKNCKCKKNRE